MKGWCKKMKIIKQELEFEECLKQRIEFICEFSKVSPTFINGSIRKLEKTNLIPLTASSFFALSA